MASMRSFRWQTLLLTVISVTGVAVRCAGVTSNAVPEADPKRQMVAVLAAPGPHPAIGEQARVWDRFIGMWDCDFGFLGDDGNVRHSPGELEFGWVLDGRAVQDLWIGYPRSGEKERSIGTSIRWFDETSKLWRVVFVNPRFVLRGHDAEGAALRWSFNDIQPNSFTWRGERSHDGGKTWRLKEEHHMKRRNPA
jgi:hypothetical protein